MDVEAAVERSRTLCPGPVQDSSDLRSSFPAIIFAHTIISRAHLRTNRLDYLNEVITAHRDLLKVSVPKVVHFGVILRLLVSLVARYNELNLWWD